MRKIRFASVFAVVAASVLFTNGMRADAFTPNPQKILIVFSDVNTPPATLRGQLLAQSGVTTVDTFDGGSATPTPAQLSNYQEVVVFSNSAFADPNLLGDEVADYLAAGGTVAALNFDWFGSPFSLRGRWLTSGYSPFNDAGATLFSNGSLGERKTADPLMQGVNTLNAFYRETLTPATGATVVADWNDGAPLIAYKGRALGVSAYVGDFSGNWSGDFGRLIVNAFVAFQTPQAPVIQGTNPSSPAQSDTPSVTGAAVDYTTVSIFGSSSCAGTPLASGSAAAFNTSGIAVPVPHNATTTLTAKVTSDGFASSCSNAFTYTNDLIAPETTINSHPRAKTESHRATFAFGSTDSPDTAATDQCSLDGSTFTSCTSPTTFSHLRTGHHTFDVRATDTAGNTDATPAHFAWKVVP